MDGQFTVLHGDCLAVMQGMPDDSVDLVFGSPPYEAARTYGIDFDLRGQEWVDWMVRVVTEASRVCRGLVAMVVEGQTTSYRWSAAPALLMADLHRAGLHLRKPPIYHRVGIPGSGGPDWLRNDYEFIVCCTRNGGRLPWSDNVAMGDVPQWKPSAWCSNRRADGTRVNRSRADVDANRARITRPPAPDGTDLEQIYIPPEIANPGNVIGCLVGGGKIGDRIAHDNEAPFPERLAEFFIRTFCPPSGTVLDPFSGSGTTAAVAIHWGRSAIAIDVRESQCELTRARCLCRTRPMFTDEPEAMPSP